MSARRALGHLRGGPHRREASNVGYRLTQNYSAVTAACLLVGKDRYLKVNGLDEANLAVAFNDVDFCLKLVKAGYRNVWTPFAELYHHESASRGSDTTPAKLQRFLSEQAYMKETWPDFIRNDPMYNPNLSLDIHCDFALGAPLRVEKSWKQ